MGGVGQGEGEAADDDGEAGGEDVHGLLDAVSAQEVAGERRDVHRREPEASDHDAGDEAGFLGREPLERRRGGGGVAETEAGAGQDAEAGDPGCVAVGVAHEAEAGADQDAADQRGLSRADLVLAFAGKDHGKSKSETAKSIRVVDGTQAPLERIGAAFFDGRLDGTLEDTPGIQHPERQVDSGSGHDYLPPLVRCCFGHAFIPPCWN